MIAGFLEVSPSPKTNYFLSAEAPAHLKRIKKVPGACSVSEITFLEIQHFKLCEKTGAGKFLRILDMG